MTAGPSICANCGQEAGPRFCGHCGQEQWSRRASLWALIAELGSEALSLDSQLVQTLRALVVPGKLTSLYLDGKRAPFLRPFRLYLLAGLLLFSSALALKAPRAEQVNLYVGEELITGQEPIPGALNLSMAAPDSTLASWIDDRPDRLGRLRSMEPQVLLDRAFSGMRALFPAALIVFLPFLALALKLLLWRTGALYYDHVIFSLNLQSALFLAIAASWLLARVAGLGTPLVVVSCILTFLAFQTLYFPVALKRVYRLGWWGTLWRSGLLLVTYLWLLDDTARRDEVARMLAGAEITDAARAAAQSLMASSG